MKETEPNSHSLAVSIENKKVVVIIDNMKAKPLLKKRFFLSEIAFAEIIIWQLDSPFEGSLHQYKYRLEYAVNQTCVLRYDNELGKGNNVHINNQELPYDFISTDRLIDDFFAQTKQMESTP